MTASAEKLDGIYVAYMAGAEGNGFGMFAFRQGVIAGADPIGVMFDGAYKCLSDSYLATVTVKVPAGGTVIQGVSSGPSGITYEVEFRLPDSFEEQEFHRVETPLGPVNIRFKRLRSLEVLS